MKEFWLTLLCRMFETGEFTGHAKNVLFSVTIQRCTCWFFGSLLCCITRCAWVSGHRLMTGHSPSEFFWPQHYHNTTTAMFNCVFDVLFICSFFLWVTLVAMGINLSKSKSTFVLANVRQPLYVFWLLVVIWGLFKSESCLHFMGVFVSVLHWTGQA